MRGLPSELIYVLVFLAVVLFQFLMKRRSVQEPQGRPEVEPDDDEQADAESKLPIVDVPAARSAPDVNVGPVHREPARTFSYAGEPRRYSRRSLLRTRRDVQNGIVIAAILGPCRALKPWE